MTTYNARTRILVVDDEDSIRCIARRVLESAGYWVIEARDGKEALAMLLEDTSVDLLMVDLKMPLLEGDEVARQIRARRPDLKVLYVSGFVDHLFQSRPTLWEGEAFLEKPFTAKGLLEAVSLQLWGHLRGTKTESVAGLVEPQLPGEQTLIWQ